MARFLIAACSIVALTACSSAPTAATDGGTDGGPSANCPDATGTWQFDYTCAGGGGGYVASVTQVGCDATLTRMDDATPTTWVATGTLGADGSVTLSGQFGFTATSCTGTVTGGTWPFTCDPGACTLTGTRL